MILEPWPTNASINHAATRADYNADEDYITHMCGGCTCRPGIDLHRDRVPINDTTTCVRAAASEQCACCCDNAVVVLTMAPSGLPVGLASCGALLVWWRA